MGVDTGVDLARLIAARESLRAGLPGEPLYGLVPDAGVPAGFRFRSDGSD
jgi:hydroxymethylglutaryl-CoA lyase